MREKKKDRLRTALVKFRKARKIIKEKCGHFDEASIWNDEAYQIVSLINEFGDLIPPNYLSVILDICEVKRTSLDIINDICKKLTPELDDVVDWIKDELEKIEAKERKERQRSPPSPRPPLPPPNGFPTKPVVGVGIPVVVIILIIIFPMDNGGPETITVSMNIDAEFPQNNELITSLPITLSVSVWKNPKISGADVRFYLDNNFLGSDFTDINGIASITIQELEPGTHTWDAIARKSGHNDVVLKDQVFEYEKTIPKEPVIIKPPAFFGRPFDYFEGRDLYNQGRYEEAITAFDKIEQDSRYILVALNYKGNALINLERYDEAISTFGETLGLDESNVAALNGVGLALVNLGEYQAAITNLDVAINLDADNTKALSNKGYALEQLGDYDNAMNYFDMVLEINPDYAYALAHKGSVLQKTGQLEQAIIYYDMALTIDPSYTFAEQNKQSVLTRMQAREQVQEMKMERFIFISERSVSVHFAEYREIHSELTIENELGERISGAKVEEFISSIEGFFNTDSGITDSQGIVRIVHRVPYYDTYTLDVISITGESKSGASLIFDSTSDTPLPVLVSLQ